MDYDFNQANPIPVSRFIDYVARTKTVSGLPRDEFANFKSDERLAYGLSRHFKALGNKSRLIPSNYSASALIQVACYFNGINRFEEARLYSKAAVAIASKNHVVYSLAVSQLFYSLSGLQANSMGGPDPTILSFYREALLVSQWHWGNDNLLQMNFHDRMSTISHKSKDPKKALGYHTYSLEVAEKALGKNHAITAGYLTRAGCYLYNMGRVEEAIMNLTQAAEIYTSLHASPSLLAEVHYYFSDCLSERGDLDGAILHAQKCRKIRERIYGLSDVRVMESCRQTAKMVLAPFQQYKGVLTPQIKQAYREAIQCHEKIFRYLQSQSLKGKLGKRGTLRRKPSLLNDKESTLSLHLGTGSSQIVISGPLAQSPYGWAPPLSASLLHKITKEIVTMKLDLIESPKHRECVRQLRSRRAAAAIAVANGLESDSQWTFNAEDARAAILRMAAVSPSVYLDDILQRIDLDDESAVEELGIVLTLTESETLGIAA